MYQTARSQRRKFGTKARNQRKRNRGISLNHSDANVLSSNGYFKILALHGIFLKKSFGVNPKKFLGESNVVKRLKKRVT